MLVVALAACVGCGASTIDGAGPTTCKSGDPTCPLYGSNSLEWSPPVSASTSALTFSDQRVSTNGNYSVTSKVTFVGTLSGGVVTGTLTLSRTGSGSITGTTISETGSSTMSVALH